MKKTCRQNKNFFSLLAFSILAIFIFIKWPAHASAADTALLMDLSYRPNGFEREYPRLKLSDGTEFNFSKILVSASARGHKGNVPLVIYLHGNGVCSINARDEGYCIALTDPRLPSWINSRTIDGGYVRIFEHLLNGTKYWGTKPPDSIPKVVIAMPASTGQGSRASGEDSIFPGMNLQDLIATVSQDLKNNPETAGITLSSVSYEGHSGVGCSKKVWSQVAGTNPFAIVYADTCFGYYDKEHQPVKLAAIDSGLMKTAFESFMKVHEIQQTKSKTDIRIPYPGGGKWNAQHKDKDWYAYFIGDKNHGTPITFGMIMMLKYFLQGADQGTLATGGGGGGSETAIIQTIACGQEKLVTPNLNVKIPGLAFSDNPSTISCNDESCLQIPFLALYITTFFKYLTGFAIIITAVIFIYSGFLYILGSTGIKIQDAKQKMSDALIGMAIFIGSYMVLVNVNPNLTNLSTLQIPCIKTNNFVLNDVVPPDQEGKPMSSTPTSGGKVSKFPTKLCGSVEECKNYCDGTKTPPNNTDGMADPEQMKTIPNSKGLAGNQKQIHPDVIEALKRAAGIAQSHKNGPYTISVASGYRPLKQQVAAACSVIKSNPAGLGPNVAFPGSSLHGVGVAVDVELIKDNQRLTKCCSLSTQTTDNKQEDVKTLQEIMSQAGFVRYCHEIWHFELGTDGAAGRSKNCPWPPP